MSANNKGGTFPVGLGLRAGRGGSVVVGVQAGAAEPRLVLSTFLATHAEGDRLSLEPYHVGAELARGAREAPAEAVAAVAEGRKRQAALATRGLEDILRKLEALGYRPAAAGLLVNRAGWITDLLSHSLSAPEHPPIAEGLAVRDALRHALTRCGVKTVKMDEKSLQDVAAKDLHISSGDLEAQLQRFGASAGRPWRKEQKLACLSALLAIAAR